jgi:BlaI family transcriptional regulator, penicillinase repressor
MISYLPTDRELQVMSILWARGSATTAAVHDLLSDGWDAEIARTTTLTYLRTLRARQWVRIEREGRGYRWSPAIPIEEARRLAVRRLADLVFDGRRLDLLAYLVGDGLTSRGTLQVIRRMVERQIPLAPVKPLLVRQPPARVGPEPQGMTRTTTCDG